MYKIKPLNINNTIKYLSCTSSHPVCINEENDINKKNKLEKVEEIKVKYEKFGF